MLAFALLLAAAVRLELQLRKSVARAAAIAERRRVAQDLHDGLAQDLAFIAAHGARIAERLGDEHPVAIAARRALATSRCTIAELSDPGAATAQEALESIAYELRDRFDMKIAVQARLGDEIAPDAREQVARIAREAIANAARHGGAENVIVSLKRTDQGVLLRVIDDGSGIDNTRSGRRFRRLRSAEYARARRLIGRPADGAAAREARDRARGHASVSAHLRLLIADHAATRVGIRMALDEEVEVCAEAGDAEQAIRAAKREQPDACLLAREISGDWLGAVRGICRAAPKCCGRGGCSSSRRRRSVGSGPCRRDRVRPRRARRERPAADHCRDRRQRGGRPALDGSRAAARATSRRDWR